MQDLPAKLPDREAVIKYRQSKELQNRLSNNIVSSHLAESLKAPAELAFNHNTRCRT
jgi:hypothetical protein